MTPQLQPPLRCLAALAALAALAVSITFALGATPSRANNAQPELVQLLRNGLPDFVLIDGPISVVRQMPDRSNHPRTVPLEIDACMLSVPVDAKQTNFYPRREFGHWAFSVFHSDYTVSIREPKEDDDWAALTLFGIESTLRRQVVREGQDRRVRRLDLLRNTLMRTGLDHERADEAIQSARNRLRRLTPRERVSQLLSVDVAALSAEHDTTRATELTLLLMARDILFAGALGWHPESALDVHRCFVGTTEVLFLPANWSEHLDRLAISGVCFAPDGSLSHTFNVSVYVTDGALRTRPVDLLHLIVRSFDAPD